MTASLAVGVERDPIGRTGKVRAGLSNLPHELLLLLCEYLNVHDVLSLAQTSHVLRTVLVTTARVWLDVFRGIPLPLLPSPQRTAATCSGQTLHACALRFKRLHLRGAHMTTSPMHPPVLSPRATTQLASTVPGDSSAPLLLRVVRGGRWVVSLSSSGRLVVWDAAPEVDSADATNHTASPAARFQLACAPYSLEARTVAWDEDEDACGAVVAIAHTSSGRPILTVLRLKFPSLLSDGNPADSPPSLLLDSTRGALTVPTVHAVAAHSLSNSAVLFALGVTSAGRRVAAARMNPSTHFVDVLVWEWSADDEIPATPQTAASHARAHLNSVPPPPSTGISVRLKTGCVYLIQLSTARLVLTRTLLLLYGTSAEGALALGLTHLPKGSLQALRKAGRDRERSGSGVANRRG
ncbi:hypothetical protein BKA62DRAFT_774846 [Auriculariales sp. MPI-PUGE-AT-0066]|nr:hypothetical protein BKA62DRAFT_774846 [Auriculariales sp. MPI-PUGE-AT-0066]